MKVKNGQWIYVEMGLVIYPKFMADGHNTCAAE